MLNDQDNQVGYGLVSVIGLRRVVLFLTRFQLFLFNCILYCSMIVTINQCYSSTYRCEEQRRRGVENKKENKKQGGERYNTGGKSML